MNNKTWNIYVETEYLKNKKRKFCIKNYKSINDLKIKIDKLTILVGENGAGKSNILEYFYKNANTFFKLDSTLKKMVKEFSTHSLGIIEGFRSDSDEIHIQVLGINNFPLSITLNEEKEMFKFTTPYMIAKDLPIEKTLKIGQYLEKGENISSKILSFFEKRIGERIKETMEEREIENISFFTTSIFLSNFTNSKIENTISNKLMKFLEIGFNVQKNQEDIFEILSFIPEVKNKINDILYDCIELKKHDKYNSVDKKISVYLLNFRT